MTRTVRLLERNWKASQCECFVARMILIIEYLLTRKTTKPLTVIRIPSSGDFYSDEYYEKLVEIMRPFPQITFFAYTRNYDIDFNYSVPNFVPIYSRDSSTKKVNLTIEKQAFVLPYFKEDVKVKHLQKYRGGVICKSNRCDLCHYCWRGSGDVYFPQKFERHSIPLPMLEVGS